MKTYLIVLRGLNVGGKNKLAMNDLIGFAEEQGFSNVSTYSQSGNLILQSKLEAAAIGRKIEKNLPSVFKLDDEGIKVSVLSRDQLQAVFDNKPKGFGEEPEKYHSDAIFLMGLDADRAMPAFLPREGVDMIWSGNGVIYSQRLSAQRTRSRLGKMMASLLYKSMTIRSWSTTTKLLDLLKSVDRD